MNIKLDAQKQLIRQIDSLYGVSSLEMEKLGAIYEFVMQKLDTCFRSISNKYYSENGDTYFNPLHTVQWTMFLYQMARQLWLQSSDNIGICNKIYGLSKFFSSADLYYEVDMPDIWFCDHPQGAVIGRGTFSDYFAFMQGCNVGHNRGIYPKFGKYVLMFSHSKVLGKCDVLDHVIFSANSYIIDTDVPAYSIVFGQYPNNTFKKITARKFSELTSSIFRSEE